MFVPRKIATGIYTTPTGFRIFVRVHPGKGGLKSQRFGKTATLTEMKNAQEKTRVAYREDPKPAVERGTLAADVVKYLRLVATMPTLKERTRDLADWVRVFGATSRSKLTRQDYQLQLQDWRLTGKGGKPLAASTVNHRRTALLHLYTMLDGKAAPNPLRDVKPFPEPPPEPRDIGLAAVKEILRAMPPSKARARVKVLAWTGIRGNSELGKMKPEHVDLKQRTCWVPTGKKGKPRLLVLNQDGVQAWREFIKVHAWSARYNMWAVSRAFHRAIATVNAARAARGRPALRDGIRLYDLRHTIAAALMRAGADLADVQMHLGHSSPRMTRRYAPFQSAKLRKAMGRLR